MTISAYITAKLGSFGYSVTVEEITAMELEAGISFSSDYDGSSSVVDIVKTALAGVIPSLLAAPDITEGGYSVKYDRTGLVQYYDMLCIDLDIENTLITKPKIKDHSNRW